MILMLLYKSFNDEKPLEGRSDSSEATLLLKNNLLLPKVLQDKHLEDFRASDQLKLPKTLLSNLLRKTKTSERIPYPKTVAEQVQSTKGF
ncbi:hypothetical protein E3N88_04607 [Mikania micrantha]|uniref:Uncharacterized protein n=1 Tax=Mikania micrantha TaxID=192012 RepID=A0A5N6PUX7_9ASTR|nr:hypothetical protein E3N88_04607 [Mikania micrantha]